jgi:hypothetical protein
VRYLVCSNCGLTLLLGGRYQVADDCPHCLEARGRAVALLPSASKQTRVDPIATLGYSPLQTTDAAEPRKDPARAT